MVLDNVQRKARDKTDFDLWYQPYHKDPTSVFTTIVIRFCHSSHLVVMSDDGFQDDVQEDIVCLVIS